MTAEYAGGIFGGDSAELSAYVTIPDAFDSLTFSASFNGETMTTELAKAAVRLFGDCDWFRNFFRSRLDELATL